MSMAYPVYSQLYVAHKNYKEYKIELTKATQKDGTRNSVADDNDGDGDDPPNSTFVTPFPRKILDANRCPLRMTNLHKNLHHSSIGSNHE